MSTLRNNYLPKGKLVGSRILVLGGSSGIGLGVAAACLREGANIIVSSSQDAKIQAVVKELGGELASSGGGTSQVFGFPCDLSSESAEDNIIQLLDLATGSKEYKLDHIVFTAGNSLDRKAIAEITIPDVYAFIQVRAIGAILLAKHAPQYMKSSPSCSITLTSGSAVAKPHKGTSAFVAVGAMVEGLARGLAIDLAPMRVNVVSPGVIQTGLLEKHAGDQLSAILENLRKETLTEELGQPDTIAEAYLYLMKDRFVTGIVLESSGGRLLK